MLKRDLVGKVYRALKRWVLRRVDIIVATAHSYMLEYYEARLNVSGLSSVILENKLWPYEVSPNLISAPKTPPLRIGYFGSLRCQHAWHALMRVVQQSAGSVEVYVRGVANLIENFDRDVQSIPGVFYGGAYRNPEDLFEMHDGITVVWAAGFHGKDSYLWARSCRFYHACAYRRPIIAQVDTDEGNIVEKLGIGCCVDLNDINSVVARIQSLTQEEVNTWYRNLCALPPSTYLYSDEHERLLERCAILIDESQQ